LGSYAGQSLTTGTWNIVIGSYAEPSSASASNEVTIGRDTITKFRVPGVDFVVEGSAWVTFNGTGTLAIRASNNVSSVTDFGTGYYRINFTNNMPDAYYAVTASATPNSQPDVSVVHVYGQNAYPTGESDYNAPTTSSFFIAVSRNDSTVYYDAQYIMVNVVR